MSELDKKTLEYLAQLGRIELTDSEKPKLLKDLQEILNYFKELEKLDTTGVEPMSGGTFQENIFREDEIRDTNANQEMKSKKIIQSFPEKEKDFLKIPPVFE